MDSNNTPSTSSGWLALHDSLVKDYEEAYKSKITVEEQYNAIKRKLIDLSAEKTDWIKKKHDTEMILNKAKENIRRIGVEKSHAKDRYFALSRESM